MISAEKHMSDSMRESLTCVICTDLFENPVTIGCGHTFCEKCLRTSIKRSPTCALCRKSVLLPLPAVSCIIKELIESITLPVPTVSMTREKANYIFREMVSIDPSLKTVSQRDKALHECKMKYSSLILSNAQLAIACRTMHGFSSTKDCIEYIKSLLGGEFLLTSQQANELVKAICSSTGNQPDDEWTRVVFAVVIDKWHGTWDGRGECTNACIRAARLYPQTAEDVLAIVLSDGNHALRFPTELNPCCACARAWTEAGLK